MQHLGLIRSYSPRGEMGTLGEIVGLSRPYYTAENPWRNNERSVSCIPEGTYTCKVRDRLHKGHAVYEVQNVPNRTHILIHVGNTHKDVEGCIVVGTGLGFVNGAWAVTNSRDGLADFMAELKNEPFRLTVQHVTAPMIWS